MLGICILLSKKSIGWEQIREGVIGTTMAPYGIVILVIAYINIIGPYRNFYGDGHVRSEK
jgi:hypothetical protein